MSDKPRATIINRFVVMHCDEPPVVAFKCDGRWEIHNLWAEGIHIAYAPNEAVALAKIEDMVSHYGYECDVSNEDV